MVRFSTILASPWRLKISIAFCQSSAARLWSPISSISCPTKTI